MIARGLQVISHCIPNINICVHLFVTLNSHGCSSSSQVPFCTICLVIFIGFLLVRPPYPKILNVYYSIYLFIFSFSLVSAPLIFYSPSLELCPTQKTSPGFCQPFFFLSSSSSFIFLHTMSYRLPNIAISIIPRN